MAPSKGEHTGKYRKSGFLINFGQFLDFAPDLSWELLNRFKILPRGVGTFSTIENLILRTFEFLNVFRFYLTIEGRGLLLSVVAYYCRL